MENAEGNWGKSGSSVIEPTKRVFRWRKSAENFALTRRNTPLKAFLDTDHDKQNAIYLQHYLCDDDAEELLRSLVWTPPPTEVHM
jgi:hypothetical protein